MKIGICDNTDCKNKNIKQPVYMVTLKEDFNFDNCNWCEDCIIRDNNMVYIHENMLMGRDYK